MRKIINGRLYDTTTATKVATYMNGDPAIDFHHFKETLFQKRNGEFFLLASGRSPAKYRAYSDDGLYRGEDAFIPLTLEDAKRWSEDHLEVDEYIAVFGPVEE